MYNSDIHPALVNLFVDYYFLKYHHICAPMYLMFGQPMVLLQIHSDENIHQIYHEEAKQAAT